MLQLPVVDEPLLPPAAPLSVKRRMNLSAAFSGLAVCFLLVTLLRPSMHLPPAVTVEAKKRVYTEARHGIPQARQRCNWGTLLSHLATTEMHPRPKTLLLTPSHFLWLALLCSNFTS